MRRLSMLAAVAVLASSAAVAASEAPAHAIGLQVCSTAVTSDCMNVKGGIQKAGTDVITYTKGNSNNTFEVTPLASYCGGHGVTSTCPFSNTSFDARYLGDEIAEIFDYGSSSLCAAEAGWSILVLEGCGANGYADVISGGTFIVSVGATNH